MIGEFQFVTSATFIGAGATLLMDLWGAFRKRFFSIRPLELRLLGRWLGYMPCGRFVHDDIARAEPVKGEAVVGWVAHYGIGCAFAVLLLAIYGLDWTSRPTPLPALVVGLGTVVAPFFLLTAALLWGRDRWFENSKPKADSSSQRTHARGLRSWFVYASALVWASLSD
jgi:hypothetical protein